MTPLGILASSPPLLPTPPMGFNNWSRFMCDLNETLFTQTADAMSSNGLLAAGYNWINLDDCWMTQARAPDGSLQWNSTLFPHGIPWLGEYVKARGFRFGIYEDAGNLTCGGYPGSLGHEALDAQTFADWGVEYLKLDGCNVFPAGTDGRTTLQEEYKHLYGLWHDVLSGMDPPLVFSESAPAYFAHNPTLSDWYTVMSWVPVYGDLARHSTDILVYVGNGSAWDSVMENYEFNTRLARYQRPGYYNDPDFLIADHRGLTLDEKRSQFALWASFGAPLIISAYVPELKGEELAYLTNRGMIEIDQDGMAQQATLASRDGVVDVLTRSLEGGDRVVTVLNRGDGVVCAKVPVSWLGLERDCEYDGIRVWDGAEVRVQGAVEVELAVHATEVYRLRLPEDCREVIPTGIVFNTASGKCLTGNQHGKVKFEACRGSEAQIWQVHASGQLRPLAQLERCLSSNGSALLLEPCRHGDRQKWSYGISGNLKNVQTGDCLTQGTGMAKCGAEMDGQVFGLPSGVEVKNGE
ncbi:putative alpha-galactosidase A [Aspergillus steynii IBT 23096]|uniref:Alpha-galactosidase n=1 Tax=Aspergillus steynii IBT 23096 TaxID=1392250 RepID=A0A2I2GMT4_9EURO|nr:putative alpha-galactosidase A [Aspergillus steynii IBT 23096]PLB54185.1 putative alpha-galactosidase A [Aspergillus steynii IBT 23096]